tara:strand:- start:5821 stop:6027 length:207 start_codon:yes stop_codon:yes gene_type:complete
MDCNTLHIRNEIKHYSKNCGLDNIYKEYCLKRNQFNPNKSPNLFNKKLQHRMREYYKSSYKSFNIINK